MPWPVKVFFVLGVLLFAQSAWALIDGYRFLRFVRKRWSSPAAGYAPLAAVVIPCKGTDTDFDSNVDRFQNQDYPHYQIVWVVAAARDPVNQRLQSRLTTFLETSDGRPRTALVVAGIVDGRGEKVNNLLRGLDAR